MCLVRIMSVEKDKDLPLKNENPLTLMEDPTVEIMIEK